MVVNPEDEFSVAVRDGTGRTIVSGTPKRNEDGDAFEGALNRQGSKLVDEKGSELFSRVRKGSEVVVGL